MWKRRTCWWALMLSASSQEFQSVKPFEWLKICLQMMTPWRTEQLYCQLTSCLLPDCALPPPHSSLEVTFTGKLKVWPWDPPVTSCGQHLHAGLWVDSTHNSPTEAFAVVTLRGWHFCYLETWWQGAAKFPWASEWSMCRNPIHDEEGEWRINSFPRCPCEKGWKPPDYQCVQETHPYRPLPSLQLTPPSKGEVWDCRMPPSQSQTDMPTGICPGRWKNACPKGSHGKCVPKQEVVKKWRKRRDRCRSGQPRARVFLPYIKGISDKISRACKPLGVQTVFTSRNTLRKSLMKVKGRKTRDDKCEFQLNACTNVCLHSCNMLVPVPIESPYQ